jgi:hypothetical protein
MSLIDDFLLAGNDEVDTDFGTSTMVCNGQTFAVVMNDERKSYEGALGGLESDIQATATAQPSDVSNPRNMLQKRATVDGVTYRVAEVVTGPIAIHFTLADTNDSR